jgi:hypothetical protein
MFSEMPNSVFLTGFSILVAILLFIIRIRIQSIPSTYEVERRIKIGIQKSDGERYVTVNDVQYYITLVSVTRKSGWFNRIKELYQGEICAEVGVVFGPKQAIPDSVSTEQLTHVGEDDVKAFFFQTDETSPSSIHASLLRAIAEELDDIE